MLSYCIKSRCLYLGCNLFNIIHLLKTSILYADSILPAKLLVTLVQQCSQLESFNLANVQMVNKTLGFKTSFIDTTSYAKQVITPKRTGLTTVTFDV